jgi:hypothetical protein
MGTQSAPPDLVRGLADRYRIDGDLGSGGMATVHRARDLVHDREVAIKVLRPELGSVLGSERFLTEIRLTARLGHPHILPVIDSGEAGGRLYYVMPLVRGRSLRERLEAEGRLGVTESVAIISQVASALDHAHGLGIVHRDIKPENILLFEGEAMLADFGLALAADVARDERLTSSGIALGTPAYMSPEQAGAGLTIGPASDIFSLAATLYEMLGGETPHAGASTHAIFARLLTEPPTPLRTLRPDLPPAVGEAVMRALAKVPADRFPSAGAFATALRAGAADAASAPTERYLRPTPSTPRRTTWIAVGVLAAVAGVGSMAWWARNDDPPAPAGRVTQLTTSGAATTPVISPDGSQVAYVEGRCDPVRCRYALVIRETASEVSRTILDGLDYAFPYQWKDDGLWLVFGGGGPDLPGGQYVISRLGGSPILIHFGSAIFAPRSDTIFSAKIVETAPPAPVYVEVRPPPWSAVRDSFGLIPPRPGMWLNGFRRSPRSDRWVYAWFPMTTGPGLLSTHDRAGQLVDSVTGIGVNYFRWNATGTAVYLPLERRPGEQGSGSLQRFAIDPRSGRFGRVDTIALAPGVTSSEVYDYAADGRDLVFQSTRPGESTVILFEGGTRGARAAERIVTRSTRTVSGGITPDGRHIFVRSELVRGTSVVHQWSVRPVDGVGDRPLAPPAAMAFAYAIEDSAVLQVEYDTAEGSRVVHYPLAGSPRVVASGLGPVADITPGPDRGVLVLAQGGDSLAHYTSTGGRLWQIAPTGPGEYIAAILTSPARDRVVAFVLAPSELVTDVSVATVRLVVIDTRTGEVVTRGRFEVGWFVPLTWGADGQLHLAAAPAYGQQTRHVRVRPTGGPLELLGPVDVPLDPSSRGWCTASNDLRRRVCNSTTILTDINLFRGEAPLP